MTNSQHSILQQTDNFILISLPLCSLLLNSIPFLLFLSPPSPSPPRPNTHSHSHTLLSLFTSLSQIRTAVSFHDIHGEYKLITKVRQFVRFPTSFFQFSISFSLGTPPPPPGYLSPVFSSSIKLFWMSIIFKFWKSKRGPQHRLEQNK